MNRAPAVRRQIKTALMIVSCRQTLRGLVDIKLGWGRGFDFAFIRPDSRSVVPMPFSRRGTGGKLPARLLNVGDFARASLHLNRLAEGQEPLEMVPFYAGSFYSDTERHGQFLLGREGTDGVPISVPMVCLPLQRHLPVSHFISIGYGVFMSSFLTAFIALTP